MLTPEQEADVVAAELFAAIELAAALGELRAVEATMRRPPSRTPLTSAAGALLGRGRPANDT